MNWLNLDATSTLTSLKEEKFKNMFSIQQKSSSITRRNYLDQGTYPRLRIPVKTLIKKFSM